MTEREPCHNHSPSPTDTSSCPYCKTCGYSGAWHGDYAIKHDKKVMTQEALEATNE